MAFLFFLWTSLVSLRIVVFSKFKNKVIQYMLALSQVLGAMSYSLLFVGHLNDRVQCTPYAPPSHLQVPLLSMYYAVSLSPRTAPWHLPTFCLYVQIWHHHFNNLTHGLQTAILGVKAYRCLNNSRIVLTVLVLCGGAFVGISTFNMTRLRGIRRLAGEFYN